MKTKKYQRNIIFFWKTYIIRQSVIHWWKMGGVWWSLWGIRYHVIGTMTKIHVIKTINKKWPRILNEMWSVQLKPKRKASINPPNHFHDSCSLWASDASSTYYYWCFIIDSDNPSSPSLYTWRARQLRNTSLPSSLTSCLWFGGRGVQIYRQVRETLHIYGCLHNFSLNKSSFCSWEFSLANKAWHFY